MAGHSEIPNSKTELVLIKSNPKLFSRILESCTISFLKSINVYEIRKNRYSNSWELSSSRDLLEGKISGLNINKTVHFATYFTGDEQEITFGFTLSTSLCNNFTWSKAEFEKNGIDTKGLKGKEGLLFANKQTVKRFLESTGSHKLYEDIYLNSSDRSQAYSTIDKTCSWILSKIAAIKMPNGLKITSIQKRYLPIENNRIKAETIFKPQRYFYSNSRNTKGFRFYDQMVEAYKPYSLEVFQTKRIQFGVICPSEYQGETEGFLKKLEQKLRSVFHFQNIAFSLHIIKGTNLINYQEVLYDESLLKSDLVYVIIS